MIGAEYDHAALILREYSGTRSDENDLFIFESMSGKGVHICTWK